MPAAHGRLKDTLYALTKHECIGKGMEGVGHGLSSVVTSSLSKEIWFTL